MKFSVLILLCILISFCASSQNITYPQPDDSSIIQSRSHYKGYGKIFRSHYEANRDIFGNQYPGQIISGFVEDVKLNEKEILSAEKLIQEHVSIEDLKFHYRQYLGYKDNEGHCIVLVNLLNFKKKKKSERYFKDWKDSFLLGHGDFYDKNQKVFIIDLSAYKLKRI